MHINHYIYLHVLSVFVKSNFIALALKLCYNKTQFTLYVHTCTLYMYCVKGFVLGRLKCLDKLHNFAS